MKEDPRHIRISEFNYLLPDERIAKFPLPVRDQSKLLLYRHGEVFEDVFTSLPDYLPADSLMIFNNTKVIQARLHFHKETGALIEVFCLEPIRPNDYALNFQQTEHAAWLCMIGNLKKWKEGVLKREMVVKGKPLTLTAERGALPWNQPLGGLPLEQSGNNICRYSRSIRRTAHPPLPEPGDAGERQRDLPDRLFQN